MQGITEGTLLGARYELEDRLAHRGEDLEYWSARDVTLQRDVAITALLAEGEYAAAAQAAVDGARRVAGVDDPRLVRVLDVGTEDADGTQVSYIVEESLGDAESLADLVLDGPLAPEEARRIIGEASAALEVAGRRGLHHQQLTPYAILRTSSGAIKVSGIATAAVLDEVEEMSSEDAARLDTQDLVALLYTGLTGRWPGVDLPDLEPAQIKGGGPVPPVTVSPDVPGDLDALCREVLRRDSGPDTPGELARRLSPWSADEVTPQRPYTAPASGGSSSPRQVTEPDEADETRDLGSIAAAAAGGAALAGTAPAGGSDDRPDDSTEPDDGSGDTEGTSDSSDGSAVDPERDRDDVESSAPPAAEAGAAPDDEDDFEDPWADELPPAGVGAAAGAASGGPARPGRSRTYHEPEQDPDRRDSAVLLAGGSGASGYGSDDAGDDESRRSEDRRTRTGIVMILFLALIAVAGFLGFQAVRGLFADDEPPAESEPAPEQPAPTGDVDQQTTTAPEPEPEETTEPAGPFEIADLTSYDPQGDNDERNDLIPNLLDGDDSTSWNTHRYLSLPWGGLKDGVGVELDLGETQPVSEVDVVFDDAQFSGEVTGEVFVGDEPDLESMTSLGDAASSRGTWTTTSEEPVEGRYVIVWFTEPGTNPAGEGYVAVSDVEVR